MKKMPLVIALALISCAPAAPRTAALYKATKAQVVDVITAVAPTVQITNAYNYWAITGITESAVSLEATPTGVGTLVGNTRNTIVWTTASRGENATLVAASVNPPNAYDVATKPFFDALNAKFERLTTPAP